MYQIRYEMSEVLQIDVEKILAAKTIGIHTVIVPEKNRKDVAEVAEEILDGMTIVYVSTMEEVLATAICDK